MTALLDHGLEATALHNHFFWETPRVFYMHVHGHGKASDLAARVKPALDLVGKGSAPRRTRRERAGDRWKARYRGAVEDDRTSGDQSGAVYKITIGRADLKLQQMGATINARMGLNTWAAFYGTDVDAVVAGDVATLALEVTPVLKALRAHGIDVVAMHHHMLGTQPIVSFCTTGARARPISWRPVCGPRSINSVTPSRASERVTRSPR